MPPFERAELTGGPGERGRTHGERFADEIERNVETYLDRFDGMGLDVDAVREQADAFVPLIEDAAPDYAAEMRGVAAGSGVPLTDIALLNVRWEVIYTALREETEEGAPAAAVDGCTSVGVTPAASADGTTYVGQNWDWIPGVELFLMDVRRDDGPDFLGMTEAGIVGAKIGLNEHGIGLAVNGLVSPADGDEPFRVPYHTRYRAVLDAERFDGALRPILDSPRACSANVLVGHADGEVIDLEAAPERVAHRRPADGILTHANHFESDAIESLAECRGPSTLYRAARLRRHLAGEDGIDAEAIAAGLRDHFAAPASVCSHVDAAAPEHERTRTNASIIADLGGRRLFATLGPPCEGEYREHRLGE